MKLNPEIIVRDYTAGSAAIRLSTRANISSARSCDVPGGNVTAPMIVPVSSLGTIPVGVMFMKNTKQYNRSGYQSERQPFFLDKEYYTFLILLQAMNRKRH